MSERRAPLTILLADDDDDDRFLARQAMEECHLINRLDCVTDGVELLDYLRNLGAYADPASYPLPAIILLDLNMPRLDGRQALREIKAEARLHHIPIIVLTTSKAEEDILRSYDLGASSFITKPVTFEGLVDVMRTMKHYWFEIVALTPELEQQNATRVTDHTGSGLELRPEKGDPTAWK